MDTYFDENGQLYKYTIDEGSVVCKTQDNKITPENKVFYSTKTDEAIDEDWILRCIHDPTSTPIKKKCKKCENAISILEIVKDVRIFICEHCQHYEVH